jgi:hypothetical protein
MKLRSPVGFALLLSVLVAAGSALRPQAPEPGLSFVQARHSPEWLKSGVIYVRSFSPPGDLKGLTARLDDFRFLGVDIGRLEWVHNSDEQHVVTFIRRSVSEKCLVSGNLSNTPFLGKVEAPTRDWTEVELPISKLDPSTVPSISLSSFGTRIFTRELRQDQP